MKKYLSMSAAAVLAATIATPSMADVSANVAASSNYVWRGVTQTSNKSAVSGGIDYSNDSGIYAGTWASNVDVGNELDLYFGYGAETNGIAYDAGYIYYAYTGNGNANNDFGEINVNASMGMFSAGLAYTVNSGKGNNNAAFDTGDIYYHLGAGGDLQDDWSWSVLYGYYSFNADSSSNKISYAHGQASVSKSAGDMGDFTFSLSGAEQTSISNNDTKAIVSWAKSF